MAILLPAVQKARERSRKVQCATRLSNLGKALHTFYAVRGQFPYGMIPTDFREPGSPDGLNAGPGSSSYYSVHVQLLPYLEEGALADRVDLGRRQDFFWDPAGEGLMTEPVEVFRCPSDWGPHGGRPGNNYRACTGPGPYANGGRWSPDGGLGAFVLLRAFRNGAFLDGLSHTIGMSEKLQGSASGYDAKRDFWYSGIMDLAGPTPTTQEMIDVCDSLRGQPAYFQPYSGTTWFLTGYDQTLYNHAVLPNSPVKDCSWRGFNPELPDLFSHGGVFGASSNHKGGVNCLYMDSAVKFISNDIDMKIWRALSTRSAGEILGGE
jgi:hypothetical protein